jgi:hypothetical protein
MVERDHLKLEFSQRSGQSSWQPAQLGSARSPSRDRPKRDNFGRRGPLL